jgi:uncharacterized protein (DUF1800 family)
VEIPEEPQVRSRHRNESVMARRVVIAAGVAALAGAGAAATASFGGGPTPSTTPGLPASLPSTGQRQPAVSDKVRRASVGNSPSATNPPVDRDSSYAAPGAGSGTRNGIRAGSPGGRAPSSSGPAVAPALGVPGVVLAIADTPENHTHLLSRLTFGPRASDYASIAAVGIDQWISTQLSPSSIADPSGDAARAAFPLSQLPIAEVRSSVKEFDWDAAQETAQATLAAQIFSERQLFEVVVDVFSNLLNVTTPSDSVWASGPDYAKSVIREHAFGRYADMLHAAMRHPAMLTYLNNEESTKTHVNENLGRELLELHSLGVASGYTEAEVLASALVLSGRSIDYDTSEFLYRADNHYVGPITTSWFSDENASAEGGLEMGDRFVDSLAKHPATAATIARKLAVRFVSDVPPDTLLTRLAETYLANDTQIVPVLTELFKSQEFWASAGAKWRRPLEDAVGSVRAVGAEPSGDLADGIKNLYWTMTNLGQAPLSWIPPNGFPDVAGAWTSASQMIARWNLHRGLADGWWKGLMAPTKINDELTPVAGQTNAQWVDAIAQRIIGRPLSPEHSAVLLAYLGEDGGTEADPGNAWLASSLAALVLDSPHFQLR